MAEIADRSSTKIGSLYRFFPNKESLAETMIASATRENLDAEFDRFDAVVNGGYRLRLWLTISSLC